MKYQVTFRKAYVETVTIEVEAKSEAEANAIGNKMIEEEDLDNEDWIEVQDSTEVESVDRSDSIGSHEEESE